MGRDPLGDSRRRPPRLQPRPHRQLSIHLQPPGITRICLANRIIKHRLPILNTLVSSTLYNQPTFHLDKTPSLSHPPGRTYYTVRQKIKTRQPRTPKKQSDYK